VDQQHDRRSALLRAERPNGRRRRLALAALLPSLAALAPGLVAAAEGGAGGGDVATTDPSATSTTSTTTSTTTTTSTAPPGAPEPSAPGAASPAPSSVAPPVDAAPEVPTATTTTVAAVIDAGAATPPPVGGAPAPPTTTTTTTVATPPTSLVALDPADAAVPAAPEDPAPVEVAVVEEPALPLVLAATSYDGVYADGVPIGVAMATTRHLESGGDYRAQAAGSTASGAYQVIDTTWNGFGGFARAVDAPPEVQDQFAYESFVAILKAHRNDVAAIPVAWYFPAALRDPALMDVVPRPDAGNVLTPRQYQWRWMEIFLDKLGEGAPVVLPADSDPLVPSIAFPVLGPVSFSHDWQHPRGEHGERLHEGIDLLGVAGQPLRAAFDGTVTSIGFVDRGIAGVSITLTRDDGLYANYFHLNDDTPGTADGSALVGLRVHGQLSVGQRVKAGQIIGYMGDSGNATGVPHLHFELRTPERIPMDPYPAVLGAQQREQCSVGIGPWSSRFDSPADVAAVLATLSPEQAASLASIVPPAPYVVAGPDGATWTVGVDGSVTATGVGALITPTQGGCEIVPTGTYGTRALGVPAELLPASWWGEEDAPATPELSRPTAGRY